MENVLELTERLESLVEKARREAQEIVDQAKREAQAAVEAAKQEAERRRLNAQRRVGIEDFLVEREAQARKEAEKVRREYEERAKKILAVSEEKIEEAVKAVLEEVLPK